MIPEINKTYYYFDDGKIRESRRDNVKINEVITFNEIDDGTLTSWEKEVIQCDWLYNKETDYFIKGRLENWKEPVIFVRTIDNGWFSLGFWAGRLDIDGTLNKELSE